MIWLNKLTMQISTGTNWKMQVKSLQPVLRLTTRHTSTQQQAKCTAMTSADRTCSRRSWIHDGLQKELTCFHIKKVNVAHTRSQSTGFQSWSRFLAVSLQVMWVINPAVGCHYFPPGLQLPPQPLRGLLPILLFGEQRHNGCEQFA